MNLPNRYYTINIYKRSKLKTSIDLSSFYKVLNLINKFDTVEIRDSAYSFEGECRLIVCGVSASDFSFVHSFKLDDVAAFELAVMGEKVAR